MKTWNTHREDKIENILYIKEFKEVSQEDLAEAAVLYFAAALRQPALASWVDWQNKLFAEGVEATRYSIEVNYRTTTKEVLEANAKIALGYVSAALKAHGYHVKMVFSEKPLRVLVSSRNWDDGEWVGLISYNPEHNCFILSKGFFNRERKTVSVQSSQKCSGDAPADMAADMRNLMH